MNETQSQVLLRRFTESIRRFWLSTVSLVDRDRAVAQLSAERFADRVIELSIRAGYREAQYLSGGVFDPTLSADRFRVERGLLVSRFMADVESSLSSSSVGLSARQRRDLRAFAATLERASLDAIDFQEAALFTNRESSRQVKRVEQAMVRQRAKTIGRTEAIGALSLGVDVAVQQTEQFRGEPIQRIWATAADEKVRSSHSTMSGQQRPLGQPFISGKGNALFRPGDPRAPIDERANCRCFLITGG